MTAQPTAPLISFRAINHMLLAAGLVLSMCAFSNAYANPDEFKWVGLALFNFMVLMEFALGGGIGRLLPDRLDAWMVAFIAYAGVSLTWSADAAAGGLAVVRWLLLGLSFVYFRQVAGDSFWRLALRAIAAANAVVMYFAITGRANWAGFANENFLTEFELISLPFLLVSIRLERTTVPRLFFAALVALEIVDLCVFNPSRIEWLVVLVAFVVGAQVLLWRRFSLSAAVWLNVAGVAVVVAILAGAWLWGGPVKALFVESIRPRLALIVNTLRLWSDAPVFGHGAGSFDALYPLYKEWHLQYFEHADILLANKMVKAGAAHNELLQGLAEYGLVGLGIVGGFVFHVLRSALGRRDSLALAAAASLTIGLVIGLIEFPLQNPATALLLAMAAAQLTRSPQAPRSQLPLARQPWHSMLAARLAVLLVAGVLLVATLRFDQSNRLFGQVASLLGSDPEAAFEANRAACRLNPLDRRMRMQLYTTLTFWTENSPEPVSSPQENDRVYEFSHRGAEHQPVLLLGRLQHLLNSGRYEQRPQETEALLEKLKRESSRMADVWILEAYYGLLREDSERAAAAIRRAQRLDPTPAQRENLERLRQAL